MTALKFMIALGILGHGINMYCDRILSIFPKGKLMMKNIQKIRKGDYAAKLMEGVSPSIPLRSGVLGIFAIVLEFFGYAALAAYGYQQARWLGVLLLVETTYSCIVSSAYHIKCGLAEYVFLKYDRTEKARDIMLDLMDSGAVLRTCFVAYVAYLITLIVAIVTGVIGFPIWAVVFTVLPLFILLYPFQIIGTVHLSAMISMFVWLLLI